MTRRVLVVVMIILLVGLPAAQHASAPSDGGDLALKHAPRTPPSSARTGAVERPSAPALPTPRAEHPTGTPPDRVPAVAPSAPFVPPRG